MQQKFRSIATKIANITRAIIILTICLFIIDTIINQLHLVSDEFGKFDNELGIKHIENKSGYFKNSDGSIVKVRINSDGFRNYEFNETKNSDTYRILYFGDSYVSSFQNLENETSAKILEQLLNTQIKHSNCTVDEKCIKNFEVYNLGVAGYSPSTYYILLNKTVNKYHPDMVIFNLLTANDISQSNYKINGAEYPYFTLENDSLVSHTFKKPYVFTINEKIGFIFKAIQRILYLRMEELRIKSKQQKIDARFDEINIYLENQSEEYKESWEIIGYILKQSKELCEEKECNFIAVTFTNGEQVTERFRTEYLKKHAEYSLQNIDFEKPEKDFMNQCNKFNITCYTTLDEIINKSKNQNFSISFQNDPHYNKYGNKMHAEILAEKISSMIE